MKNDFGLLSLISAQACNFLMLYLLYIDMLLYVLLKYVLFGAFYHAYIHVIIGDRTIDDKLNFSSINSSKILRSVHEKTSHLAPLSIPSLEITVC